jgi:hypothetical protein
MDPEGARRAGKDPARYTRWEPYFERSIDAVIAVSRNFVAVVSAPSQGKTAKNGSVAASKSRSSRRSSRTSPGRTV